MNKLYINGQLYDSVELIGCPDDKLDALRYALGKAYPELNLPVPKQILPPVDCSTMAVSPPIVQKMQEEVREFSSHILPFCSGAEQYADLCVNGKFLMQVPAWAIPHVHRLADAYIGVPNTHRHRENLRKDIQKIIYDIRKLGIISPWPAFLTEPEEPCRIDAKFWLNVEVKNKMTIPEIKKVIYSGKKTIIIWADDTKTITSCAEGEKFDEYYGFCSAVVKKLFGSTTAAKKALNKVRVENKNKIKKEEGTER